MNFDEAMNYIEAVSCSGIMPGLVRIEALLDQVGHPEKKCNVIHVAGTNGKGSVCTFISSVLMCAGYRVGRYISPTLFDYRERIQVNGQWISKKDTVCWMSRVCEANEAMQTQGMEGASAFEIETVMAFLYFEAMDCDFVVLETGMGGRLDATNVVPAPVISVITSIGMDHMRFLGNSFEDIAAEKGGIIKEGRPVVIGAGRKEAVEVLVQIAQQKHSEYAVVGDQDVCVTVSDLYKGQIFDFDDYRALKIRMPGSCQPWNAAIAVRALTMIGAMDHRHFVKPLRKLPGICIHEVSIRKGLDQACWPGRFEVIEKNPPLIIDGAHNPDGVRSLTDSMACYLADWPILLIMGVFADKDYSQMLQEIADFSDTLITFKPENPRGLEAERLSEEAKPYFTHTIAAPDQEAALKIAREHSNGKMAIVCFGSLSTMAGWYRLTGRKPSDGEC